MNTGPKFKLQISPQKELELLVILTAGLAANEVDPRFCVDPGNGEALEVADVARILLDQLRENVEQNVEQSGLADQMPTS